MLVKLPFSSVLGVLLPPHQRLLLGFGPCYFLALVVITPAELTLSQGGNLLLLVRHCCWEGGLYFFNGSKLWASNVE